MTADPVGLYAAKSAVLVAAQLQLGNTATRLLLHMALECWDDEDNPGRVPPRRYFGRRELSAIALGFLAPENGSEAAFRALQRATKEPSSACVMAATELPLSSSFSCRSIGRNAPAATAISSLWRTQIRGQVFGPHSVQVSSRLRGQLIGGAGIEQSVPLGIRTETGMISYRPASAINAIQTRSLNLAKFGGSILPMARTSEVRRSGTSGLPMHGSSGVSK